jgi:WbqC-like protein family
MVTLSPEKTIAVLQPGYLPWLGFFDQMAHSDVFVIYDDVQFDKHGWRNRNRIKSPAGSHWLTVPVLHAGKNLPANNSVEIDGRQPWARKHIGSIRQFYGGAPFLSRYLPELEELLHRKWTLLIDLDLAVLTLLCKWLELRTTIVRSSSLGIQGGQSERLVNHCLHFGAGRYLSGAAARDYLLTPLFNSHHIDVIWQDYSHPTYPQLHGAFISHLSTLDLLLNCGDQSRSILLSHSDSAH